MQKEAYEWYEMQRNGLGELFLKELDGYYHKIQSLPNAFSKIDDKYRQAALKKFPYVIVFRIIKTEVVIYAVFHTSRNPSAKLKGN